MTGEAPVVWGGCLEGVFTLEYENRDVKVETEQGGLLASVFDSWFTRVVQSINTL